MGLGLGCKWTPWCHHLQPQHHTQHVGFLPSAKAEPPLPQGSPLQDPLCVTNIQFLLPASVLWGDNFLHILECEENHHPQSTEAKATREEDGKCSPLLDGQLKMLSQLFLVLLALPTLTLQFQLGLLHYRLSCSVLRAMQLNT